MIQYLQDGGFWELVYMTGFLFAFILLCESASCLFGRG